MPEPSWFAFDPAPKTRDAGGYGGPGDRGGPTRGRFTGTALDREFRTGAGEPRTRRARIRMCLLDEPIGNLMQMSLYDPCMGSEIVPDELRIGIITDWERCYRGNGWPALLEQLGQRGLPSKITFYPIADLILRPVDSDDTSSTHGIRKQHVLIVNWDAANGDPDFGAHLTIRWLEHRRPEILGWVRMGNILLIESQTVLGVPSQAAYNAVVGSSELPVCGPQDRRNPLQQNIRVGGHCKRTRHYPDNDAFKEVPEPLSINGNPSHDQMFPGDSDKFLIVDIKSTNYKNILYRGWFRRSLPGARDLPWVSILQTDPGQGADRRQTRWNQSTMQVARLGEGAIFATTMLLATTGQIELVKAILTCANGQTSHLPEPKPLVARLQGWWKATATLTAGAAVVFLTNLFAPWLHKAAAAFGVGPAAVDPKSVASFIYSVAAGGALVACYRTYGVIRKAVQNFIGY